MRILFAVAVVLLLAAPPAAAQPPPPGDSLKSAHTRGAKVGPRLPRDKKVDRWLAAAGVTPSGEEERYGWALVVLALDLREEDPEGAGCIWRSVRSYTGAIAAVDPAALPIDEEERAFLLDQLEADRFPLGEKPPIEPDRNAPLPPLGEEPEVLAPERVVAFYPAYTPAARKAQTRGPLRLTGIVGSDGRYRQLRVVEARPNGLTHTAIAAACGWRFEPARRVGEGPVAVLYEAGFVMEP